MDIIYFLFALLGSTIPAESEAKMKTLENEIKAWYEKLKDHPLGCKIYDFFAHPLTRFGLLFLYAPIQRAYWRYSKGVGMNEMDDYEEYED